MKWYRFARDLIIVTFVSLMLVTKISQSWSYWWIAVVASLIMMFPDFVSLYRPGEDKELSTA